MKKTILSLLLAVAGTASLFAQGTVNFANVATAFTTTADRLVYLNTVGTVAVVGTQFKAQLYASDSANGTFTAVDATPSSFRVTTTSNPGTWSTVNKIIPAPLGAEGNNIFLKVAAWDSTTGNTFETATRRGISDAFAWKVPAAGDPPGAVAMENFRAFAIVVPEPGTFALAGLGLLGLVMARRKK